MDRFASDVTVAPADATWTVTIERLAIQLAVGVYCDEREPQALWVSLSLEGLASAAPSSLSECIDYEPLYRWLTQRWPLTPHTPLLETRLNELIKFAFDLDPRVHKVRAGLYKQRMSQNAVAVGVERLATRVEFEAHEKSRTIGNCVPIKTGQFGDLKCAETGHTESGMVDEIVIK